MSIKLLPIGGLGEFGKNMFIIEGESEILILDCGVGFPEEYLKGIDLLIPDFKYLKSKSNKKFHLLVTHAHEDHIGAIPFLLDHFKVEIYSSPFTLSFIQKSFSRYEQAATGLNSLTPFQKVKLKDFSFYPIPVTHSIPESFSFMIESGSGRILFTGDFRIETNPFYGSPFNISPFKSEGERGVDLLIMDSTNSNSPGSGKSEISLYEPLREIFNLPHRVVFSTFSSHISRVGLLVKICKETNRKIFISGRAFENSVEISLKHGFLDGIMDLVVPMDEISSFSDEEICVLATGSQGEYRSAMFRIYDNSHSQFKVRENDIIILSSKIIPGNEIGFYRMVNAISKMGGKVYHEKNSQIHVSGHAKQEELKTMISAVKPKFFLPAHGDFVMLQDNVKLAEDCGVKNHILIENGQSVIWNSNSFEFSDKIDIEMTLIEADSKNEIDYETTKERLKIGQYGLILCSVIKDFSKKKLIASKSIEIIGLSPSCKEEQIIKKAFYALKDSLQGIGFNDDFLEYKEQIRINVRKVFKEEFDMKPVTIVQLHEIH